MLAPANTSLIIPRQRRNAERVCPPASPGLAAFAAYFRLIPTTSAASARRNAARTRGGAGSAARSRMSGDETNDMAALPCDRGHGRAGETLADGPERGQPGLTRRARR